MKIWQFFEMRKKTYFRFQVTLKLMILIHSKGYGGGSGGGGYGGESGGAGGYGGGGGGYGGGG